MNILIKCSGNGAKELFCIVGGIERHLAGEGEGESESFTLRRLGQVQALLQPSVELQGRLAL